ncbi:hypothetical protein HWN40_07400 [Methanolobus zinderi]|uniref:Uncharacterized protein n=1 Tax=Methanolobus zinderi TaxID=536044 RepID=A0A7D5E825_9EURY|nr:hypothetical protein [Methanolobus zinderi]QLC50078.1 hypothetical protein HWN40_07400 [Methanolobus zinderi]
MVIMLPDYPEIKKIIQTKFERLINEESKKGSFLSVIREKRIYEGDFLESTSIDGYLDKREYAEISETFSVTKEEIIEKGFDAYFEQIPEIAQKIKNSKEKQIIDKIDEVTDRVGNVINGKSKSFAENYLEVLEKMSISFDEYGFPIIPTLIVSPEFYEKSKDEISAFDEDPVMKKKFKDIIYKKKGEWLDKEDNRKLVD